ncbi:hypothetical protein RBH26_04465 [Natronolimnohabitans sp. A-GB9]|uniref:DUF7289 family protein n=1 Tax=Natronolimnohabitans sp. A-GB9 TaxID=3069757 RepID=UPI0027B0D79B|nr:hypothetical protein [Natronolimnohabitans sp. A-GB9]MDQ2049730.1 hypothetical protein [Natronolimnohabitans sp. A-GB9]
MATPVTRSSSRGQSTVLGIVLLIGIVAAGSIGILLIAGDMISNSQQQSEQEQVEQTFVELSKTMSAAATDDTANKMRFNAGDHGAIVKTEAGHINITGDNFDEPIDVTVGAIEYQGEDGTAIAYQAGGVFRGTGNETQIVSAPPLDYDVGTSTLTFPIIEVENEGQIDSGDVSISHSNTTTYQSATYAEQSTITVNITSEYCVGWENYFEQETRNTEGQVIQETCNEGTDNSVEAKLGRFDISDGTFEDGIVTGEANIEGGGQHANLDLSESDQIYPQLDSEIGTMVDDAKDDNEITNLTNVSEEPVPEGKYFAKEVVGEEYTFDVSEGNTTLIVEGDIGDSSLAVEGTDNNTNSLQIFSEGDLYYNSGHNSICATDCSEPINSQALQIYGTSEMHVGMDGGNSDFEGVIYAPAGGNEFKEGYESDEIDSCGSQLCLQAAGDLHGSVVVSSATVKSAAPEGMYDPELENFSPTINPDSYVFPPHLTYLNIAEYKVDIED